MNGWKCDCGRSYAPYVRSCRSCASDANRLQQAFARRFVQEMYGEPHVAELRETLGGGIEAPMQHLRSQADHYGKPITPPGPSGLVPESAAEKRLLEYVHGLEYRIVKAEEAVVDMNLALSELASQLHQPAMQHQPARMPMHATGPASHWDDADLPEPAPAQPLYHQAEPPFAQRQPPVNVGVFCYDSGFWTAGQAPDGEGWPVYQVRPDDFHALADLLQLRAPFWVTALHPTAVADIEDHMAYVDAHADPNNQAHAVRRAYNHALGLYFSHCATQSNEQIIVTEDSEE